MGHGADVNVADKEENTPFMYGVEKLMGILEIFRMYEYEVTLEFDEVEPAMFNLSDSVYDVSASKDNPFNPIPCRPIASSFT